jgi:nucleotide-binding universal stress UspA family protein
MVKRVIVPLDTSPEAESVLPLAFDLARHAGADVLLLSVLEVPHEFAAWADSQEVLEGWAKERLERDQYLQDLAAGVDDLSVETITLAGNPTSVIASAAAEALDPLLVMGSHGRSGWKRHTIGSVTFGVVHSVTCPVVVARVSADGAPAEPVMLDRVVVPLDGSRFSEVALQALDTTFRDGQASIHLLRVVETAGWYGGAYATLDSSAIAAYREAVNEASASYLIDVAARLSAEGKSVTWEVRDGLAASQIGEVADEQDAGMVIMATHGRSGFSRLMLGSVAEQTLRELQCPLMLVRPDEAGEHR